MRSSLKEKIARGELVVGTWNMLPGAAIAEILCQSGFDFIAIDEEHSTITVNQAEEIIRVADLCGCIPAVRVSKNDIDEIKRMMDAGAYMIIVPMIKSSEDAKKAVRAVKYPPQGERGVGLARAQHYGFDLAGCMEWNARESVVVVQIEHIDAIRNIDEILEVEGVDASYIGPYDLSASIGCPGDFDDPRFLEAVNIYESSCRKHNKPMGFHVVVPDKKKIIAKIEEGYRFLAVGIDEIFLGKACRETLEGIVPYRSL